MIAKKRDHNCAYLTVARELSVSMHAMWHDDSTFQFEVPRAREKPQVKRGPKHLAITPLVTVPRAQQTIFMRA